MDRRLAETVSGRAAVPCGTRGWASRATMHRFGKAALHGHGARPGCSAPPKWELFFPTLRAGMQHPNNDICSANPGGSPDPATVLLCQLPCSHGARRGTLLPLQAVRLGHILPLLCPRGAGTRSAGDQRSDRKSTVPGPLPHRWTSTAACCTHSLIHPTTHDCLPRSLP